MKFIRHLIAMAFAAILFLQGALAQNTCAAPFVIPSIPFNSGTQTTCGTGNDYGAGFAPCVSTNYGGGEDYIYQLNVTAAPVTYQFTLGGAATWKILSLHSACPPAAGNCLSGVANSTGAGNFQYAFATNGTYYLVVDTWPTPTCGEFTVSVSLPAPPAPCQNSTQYPSTSVAIDPNGTQVTISTCSFAGEYSVVTGAAPGQTLRFTSSITGDQITVRSGAFNGPVLAFGPSPLTFANSFTGTVYAHWNTTSCGSSSSCRTTTVQCTNCPIAPDPCLSISALSCGTPVTATASGAGAWSPNSCGFTTSGQEKVYSFTPTTTGMHTLVVNSATGGYADYFFKAASGGCNSTGWTCIGDANAPESNVFGPLTAGTAYYILFDPEVTTSITHNFRIDCPPSGSTPACVSLPTSPTNGQTAMCPSATTTLSWPSSAGATSYNVYFGTTNPPPFVGNVATTSYVANTPSAATYFWQILPSNSFGTATGCAVWNFTKATGAYTVPAFGASTVACPSLIVQPAAPPAVTTNCGTTVTPTGPTITNNPNPITCEGTRTYTWTYNNGFGQVSTWNHVVTVERQPFSINTPNGAATVACPDQTDAQPTPPAVLSNCGEVLTPVVTSTAKPGCEGNRNWVFTYTDCEGNQAVWTYVYTVEYQDYTVPASETLTVNCPSAMMEPTPPMVLDNCGNTVNMAGPVVSSTNSALGCETGRSYTWTYQDCEGNSHTWSRTYNIQYTGDFFLYPNGEENVACVLYAVPPFPPVVYDNCGQEVKVTGPAVSESISSCSGSRTYTYVYTSCTGTSKTWTYTFNANDNEPPVGNCTSGSLASVDVTNLGCLADVPCPESYDFSQKGQELLAAGGFYDVCSGANLTVEMDSWSALWECADPDGNGVNTFGRTFYFRITDQCGNEYPTLCGVTYSGTCTPIETFPMQAWGVAGGEPGTVEGTTDVQVISTLLNNNPLVVGGGNRSLTFTDANCVVALLPGLGNPTVLGNCHQTDCATSCNPAGPEGMKNSLAANTAALMLNMRYNVSYNALAMATVRNQSLSCVDISPNIAYCTGEPVACKLRVFESNGTLHEFPYNIGGLLDLANLYLGGNLQLTATFSNLYAAALNQSVASVNDYFHGDMALSASCDPTAGVTGSGADQSANKSLPTGKVVKGTGFSLAPNPAGSEVNFKLGEMEAPQNVVFEIYNALGQQVLRRDFGQTTYLNERIELTGLGSGMYIVSVKAGNERYEQKLFISRD